MANPISRLIPRMPLAGLAVSAMLGVGLGLHAHTLLPLHWAAVFCALGIAALVLRRAGCPPFPHVGVLLAFTAHAWLSLHSPAPRELANRMEREGEYLGLVGIVCGEPTTWVPPGKDRAVTQLPLRAEGVLRDADWQRANGRVLARFNAVELPELAYGDRVSLSGKLTRQPGPGIGLLRSRYRMKGEPDSLKVLSSGHGNPLLTWCFVARERCARQLETGIEGYLEEQAILRALLLGYRSELPEEMTELFAATGTMHIFAISGLHVGIIAMMCIVLIRACGLPQHRWILVLFPLLLVFTMSTGMRASAVRAMLMASLFWGAPLIRRRPHAPSALFAAALAVLLIAPGQLVDPGFIYSFIIVAGLILLYPKIMNPLRERFDPDPWAPQQEDAFARWFRLRMTGFAALVVISLAAWLTSAPLTAMYFNRFTPVALAGNLVVVPGTFFIIASGALSLVTGLVSDFASEVFNHAARVMIAGLLWIIQRLNDAPGAHRYIATPAPLLVFGYYGLLGVCAVQRKFGLLAGGLAVLLVTAGVGEHRLKSRRLAVDFLPVPDGQASLLHLEGRHAMIDAGPAWYGRSLLRRLRSEGVGRLEVLVLTHADADHVGGALILIDELQVQELWIPVVHGRSPVFRKVLEAAESRGIPIRRLAAGERGELHGVAWEVFHPSPELKPGKADEASLVLRIAHGQQAVLFTGGANSTVETRLLAQPLEPAAPVLVFPCTDDELAVDDSWLERVHAERAILFPEGFDGSYRAERTITRRIRGVGVLKIEKEPLRYNLRTGDLNPGG